MEAYTGVTNATGDFYVVFAVPFIAPDVMPVCYPPADATTRVRVTAVSQNGFTVKTERNSGVNVLGIDVLLLAASNVPSIPVRVIVVES